MTLSGAINNVLEKRMVEITTPGANYQIRNPLVPYKTIGEKIKLYTDAIKNFQFAQTENMGKQIPLGRESFYTERSYVCTPSGVKEVRTQIPRQGTEIDKVELINGIWYLQRDIDWDKVINIETTVNGWKVTKPFVIFNELKYPTHANIKYYEATPAYWDNYGLRNQFGPVYIIAKYDATPQPLCIAQEYLKTQNVLNDTLKLVTDAMAKAIFRTSH